MKTVRDFIFLGSKSLRMVTAAMKLKSLNLKSRHFHVTMFWMLTLELGTYFHILFCLKSTPWEVLWGMPATASSQGCSSGEVPNTAHLQTGLSVR